uniref:Uncharacterized protein n=1 Tax=Timema shepardi TaxID=629360 RepID=A0A7R9G677_TIMSH|nr:unnamed protein product [Timema shepardi]
MIGRDQQCVRVGDLRMRRAVPPCCGQVRQVVLRGRLFLQSGTIDLFVDEETTDFTMTQDRTRDTPTDLEEAQNVSDPIVQSLPVINLVGYITPRRPTECATGSNRKDKHQVKSLLVGTSWNVASPSSIMVMSPADLPPPSGVFKMAVARTPPSTIRNNVEGGFKPGSLLTRMDQLDRTRLTGRCNSIFVERFDQAEPYSRDTLVEY